MEIKTGHFNLFPLLAHVAENPKLIPWGPSAEGKKYRAEVDRLLKGKDGKNSVPDKTGGWYVWGRFNDAAWFQPIYIGMSSPKEKAGLYQRLYDELTKECLSVFAAVYGRDATLTTARKHYRSHTEKDYFKGGEGPQRNLRRTDAQFVIWVADENLKDEDRNFEKVESALIEIYRPSNNSKRLALHKRISDGDPAKQEIELVREKIDKQIDSMSGDFKI